MRVTSAVSLDVLRRGGVQPIEVLYEEQLAFELAGRALAHTFKSQ
jgi:hypothetical protein